MNKLLIILSLICISTIAQAQNDTKTVEVDIRGRSCIGGLGICNVNPGNESQKSSSPKKSMRSLSDHHLILALDINQLSPQESYEILSRPLPTSNTEEIYFTQEFDFVFTDEMLEYLGMDIRYNTIKKGDYPLTIIEDHIEIDLELSKTK